MGGKGRRRRERNYVTAHGGGNKSLLPPPPDPSKLDSLPSKLRTLISLSSSLGEQSSARTPKPGNRKDGTVALKSKANKLDARGESNPSLPAPRRDVPDDSVVNHDNQKKRKKRNRGEPVDLRFQSSDDPSERSGSRRKERKKAYKELKKKKKKKSSDHPDGDFPFPGHDKVEFGDVVDQPPRLAVLPKVMKFFEDASKQRLRLQAIEAYRNRKGWASRPGINLAPDATFTKIIWREIAWSRKYWDEDDRYDSNTIVDNSEVVEEAALSFSDLPVKLDQKQHCKKNEENCSNDSESEFEFWLGFWSGSGSVSTKPLPEMCEADELFFQDRILPLRCRDSPGHSSTKKSTDEAFVSPNGSVLRSHVMDSGSISWVTSMSSWSS